VAEFPIENLSLHQEIIDIYSDKYEGFGPTLASEYLKKDGYEVIPETLRQWLRDCHLICVNSPK
jgi:hypothetical protein